MDILQKLHESIKSQREIEKIADNVVAQLKKNVNEKSVMSAPGGLRAEQFRKTFHSFATLYKVGYRGPLDDFTKKFEDLEIRLAPAIEQGHGGSYSSWYQSIDVYYQGTEPDWSEVRRTVVHELTHAYDDFISKGKYANKQGDTYKLRQFISRAAQTLNRQDILDYAQEKGFDRKSAERIYNQMVRQYASGNFSSEEQALTQARMKEYYSLPHEINARYQETVDDLKDIKMLNPRAPRGGFENYLSDFKQRFAGWLNIDKQSRNKLVNRLYKEYYTLRTSELRYLIAQALSNPIWRYATDSEPDYDFPLRDSRIRNVDLKIEARKLIRGIATGRITDQMLKKRWRGVYNALVDMKGRNPDALRKLCSDFNVPVQDIEKAIEKSTSDVTESVKRFLRRPEDVFGPHDFFVQPEEDEEPKPFGIKKGSGHKTSGHKYFWGKRGAGLIVVHGRDILLCKRSSAVNEPHTWSYPGGKIDNDDEEPKNAAIREFREETGYRGKFMTVRQLYEYKKDGFTYTTFVAYIADKFTPKLDWENSDWGWFRIDDLPERLHPGMKTVLPILGKIMDHMQDVMLKSAGSYRSKMLKFFTESFWA